MLRCKEQGGTYRHGETRVLGKTCTWQNQKKINYKPLKNRTDFTKPSFVFLKSLYFRARRRKTIESMKHVWLFHCFPKRIGNFKICFSTRMKNLTTVKRKSCKSSWNAATILLMWVSPRGSHTLYRLFWHFTLQINYLFIPPVKIEVKHQKLQALAYIWSFFFFFFKKNP